MLCQRFIEINFDPLYVVKGLSIAASSETTLELEKKIERRRTRPVVSTGALKEISTLDSIPGGKIAGIMKKVATIDV